MLYDEINYILYTRKPVKILDLNGFIIYLYYLARTISQRLRLWYMHIMQLYQQQL